MAKSKVKNKKPSQLWKKITLAGNELKRAPTCPRCGTSYFLALHKDRKTCGKCAYTEFGK